MAEEVRVPVIVVAALCMLLVYLIDPFDFGHYVGLWLLLLLPILAGMVILLLVSIPIEILEPVGEFLLGYGAEVMVLSGLAGALYFYFSDSMIASVQRRNGPEAVVKGYFEATATNTHRSFRRIPMRWYVHPQQQVQRSSFANEMVARAEGSSTLGTITVDSLSIIDQSSQSVRVEVKGRYTTVKLY